MKKYTNIRRHHLVESALVFLTEDGFDVLAFINRIESVKRLIARGATAGEKAAAELALERLVGRAKTEIPKLSVARQRELLAALRDTPSDTVTPPPSSDYTMPDAGVTQKYESRDGTRADLKLSTRGYLLRIKIGRKEYLKTDDGKIFRSYQRGDQFHYSMGDTPGTWVCALSDLTEPQVCQYLAAYKLKLVSTGASAV